ncbi:hypothetical protein [Serinicoccus sediminis]|uniref:hypothetical protein n=1 Tax=Serinicoccus sediminis TaxID=2306021 RepID=UPI00102295FE|nr:hypothetical protein [Serinicoccus sediminis]
MTTHTHDANALLMGGGGAPTWKFDTEGIRKVGTVTSPPEARQEREYDPGNPGGGAPKFFPSGDPIMGILVEVQTDERDPSRDGDDGRRTFYIEGKRLKDAVKAGIRAAGGSGLEVGGVLDVTLTRYDVPGDRRSGRNWQIAYTPAGNAQLMSEQAPAPAAQTAPVAQPQQQPAPAASPAPQAAAQPASAGQPTPEALAAFQAWQASQQQQAG